MMIKAIIVDDEKNGREILRELLATYCPEVNITATASTLGEAIRTIKNNDCDIIFLDLRIGKELGLDLINTLPDPAPLVIVTTAYKQYALQALRAHVFDYLLKPIASDELKNAVDKAKEKLKEPKSITFRNMPDVLSDRRITLGTAEGLLVVAVNNIVSCKANGNYTEVFLRDGRKIVTSTHLGEFEKLLTEEEGFIRIHHASLINLKEIQMYLKVDGGYVLMSDQSKIQVSQRKKSDLLKALRSLGGL